MLITRMASSRRTVLGTASRVSILLLTMVFGIEFANNFSELHASARWRGKAFGSPQPLQRPTQRVITEYHSVSEATLRPPVQGRKLGPENKMQVHSVSMVPATSVPKPGVDGTSARGHPAETPRGIEAGHAAGSEAGSSAAAASAPAWLNPEEPQVGVVEQLDIEDINQDALESKRLGAAEDTGHAELQVGHMGKIRRSEERKHSGSVGSSNNIGIHVAHHGGGSTKSNQTSSMHLEADASIQRHDGSGSRSSSSKVGSNGGAQATDFKAIQQEIHHVQEGSLYQERPSVPSSVKGSAPDSPAPTKGNIPDGPAPTKGSAPDSSRHREEDAAASSTAPHRKSGEDNKSERSSYVALCLAVKEEHENVREWVQYHRSIGVGRFYVYDDGSHPPLRDSLAEFIKSGLVQYRLLEGVMNPRQRQQVAIYDDCLKRHGSNHTWLGAWDTDEFLIIMDGSPDLPAVLRRYEQYGGLTVNWRMFGSSGHATRPSGGVLQSYTRCTSQGYPENVHVKSLANTRHVDGAGWSPHHFDYKPGLFAVNTNLSRVDSAWSDPPVGDVLVMNHYVLRSAEEFERKLARGSAMGSDRVKTRSLWNRVEKWSVENCTYAVPLGRQVAEQLRQADGPAALERQHKLEGGGLREEGGQPNAGEAAEADIGPAIDMVEGGPVPRAGVIAARKLVQKGAEGEVSLVVGHGAGVHAAAEGVSFARQIAWGWNPMQRRQWLGTMGRQRGAEETLPRTGVAVSGALQIQGGGWRPPEDSAPTLRQEGVGRGLGWRGSTWSRRRKGDGCPR